MRTNTKAVFAYTKSQRKKNSLPNTIKFGNEETIDVNGSKKNPAHFQSVYAPSSNATHGVMNAPAADHCTCTDHIEITTESVAAAIRACDRNTSSSPDKIPTYFHSRTDVAIAVPLTLIFRETIHSREFPLE